MTTEIPEGFVIRELTNTETGESLTFLEAKAGAKGQKPRLPESRSRDPFVLLFGTELLAATANRLHDRLFWYLVDQMKIDEPEQVYLTAEIAEKFGTHPDLITRALQRLEQERRIFRLRRFRLVVNPSIVWRGTPLGRERAIDVLRKAGKL